MDSVYSDSVYGQPDAIRRVGAYDLLEAIGSGGMSHVYRARHGRTGEIVAAKVLHIDDVAPEVERRLRREPEVHQGIGHDNIVRLFEWFRVEDEFFLIMEYVEGESLAQILHRRGHPFSLDEASGYFRQLLSGVGHLHELGIIHRDIKPANILLRRDGVIKLADFGIAKFAWQQEGTRTHLGIGTPEYMSPEQVRGSAIDHRSDIYSLGVTLFEMLTARRPWTRTEPTPMAYADVIHDVLNAPLPDPRELNPDIPASIVAILNVATAKEPLERFQSTAGFQRALDSADVAETPPTRAIGGAYSSYSMKGGKVAQGFRRYRWAMLAAMFLLAAFAGFGFYRMFGSRGAPPQLGIVEAASIVAKVALRYQGYMRAEDAKGLASLFDPLGVEYSTLGVTTRDSIEKETRKFFAGTRIETFNVQAADVAVANDSTITSTWRSIYRRVGPREEVRGVSSAFVQLERRDSGWNITIFRRNGPSVDTVWTKPLPAKPRPAARKIPVPSSVQLPPSGPSEIDLTEVRNWIDRHLDVRIGPGRGNGKGHGKKAKKHKNED